MKAILIALLCVALIVNPADAAIIDIGAAFGSALQPYIDAVVNGAIAAIIGWLAWIAKNRFNVDIEVGYRDALTTFLQRQASSLVAAGAVKLQGVKVEVNNQALADAAKMALTSIPQALSYFGLNPAKVAEMIIDYIPKQPAISEALAVAVDVQNPSTPSKPAA